MEKEKTKLYQKWWFWLCIVLIVLIIGFTSIVMVGFNIATSGISGVARQIQDISKNTTLYSSAGNNTLILEIDHFDQLKDGDLEKIINIIKENTNTTFEYYSKLIILNYIDVKNQETPMLMIKEYSMPNFTETKDLTYVDYNIYENTMKNYTQLFNSIGR